jgi:hypothetical protein
LSDDAGPALKLRAIRFALADVLLHDQTDKKQELRAAAGGNGRKLGTRLIGY